MTIGSKSHTSSVVVSTGRTHSTSCEQELSNEVLDIEDAAQLLAYLRHRGHVGTREIISTRVLAGGVSNRTVLVRRASGEAWVLKQALPKLRVDVDWFCGPERVHKEALGMRWLKGLAPPGAITSQVFEDHDDHILAMRAVPEPHENWKTMLLCGRVEAAYVEQFGRILATVHRNSFERRDELARVFEDRSFFEALRLEPYYDYAAQQVPEAGAFLDDLAAETRGRQTVLTHGDYSPKNILVHDDRLILLDHEAIHFGDPAFDLGFSLAHFLSKAHHLQGFRDVFARAAELYWTTYRECLGSVDWATDLEVRTVRHTLGCLLARVAGRSPLEYLNQDERGRQKVAVLSVMADSPPTMAELIAHFVRGL